MKHGFSPLFIGALFLLLWNTDTKDKKSQFMRKKLISSARENFHQQWDFCDERIRTAINECVQCLGISDSIKSPVRSIRKKVESYLDEPFEMFVSEYGGWIADQGLSSLLDLDMHEADVKITKWAKIVSKNFFEGESKDNREDVFFGTVDTLRDFVKVCFFMCQRENQF